MLPDREVVYHRNERIRHFKKRKRNATLTCRNTWQLWMGHYQKKHDMNTKCCRNTLSSRHCRKILDPKQVTYGSLQWPLFSWNFGSEDNKFSVHRKDHYTENSDPITMVLYYSGIRQIDLMTHSLKFIQITSFDPPVTLIVCFQWGWRGKKRRLYRSF